MRAIISEDEKQKFLEAYAALCKSHHICFDHEDSHGAFIVTDYDERHMKETIETAYIDPKCVAPKGGV